MSACTMSNIYRGVCWDWKASSGKSRERGVPGKLYSAQPFVISESCSVETFETMSRCTKDFRSATVLHLQVGA